MWRSLHESSVFGIEMVIYSGWLQFITARLKKETLEADLGNGVKFTVTVTLLLHLSGMEPDAKPELFNLKFRRFADELGYRSRSPMANMPNMRCLFTQRILISKLLGE